MLVFGGEAKLYTPLLGGYGYETRPPSTWALSLGNPIHWVAALANPAAEGPIAEVGGALVADDAGRYAWLIPGDQGSGCEATRPTGATTSRVPLDARPSRLRRSGAPRSGSRRAWIAARVMC
jgi:hypothetical protein